MIRTVAHATQVLTLICVIQAKKPYYWIRFSELIFINDVFYDRIA